MIGKNARHIYIDLFCRRKDLLYRRRVNRTLLFKLVEGRETVPFRRVVLLERIMIGLGSTQRITGCGRYSQQLLFLAVEVRKLDLFDRKTFGHLFGGLLICSKRLIRTLTFLFES